MKNKDLSTYGVVEMDNLQLRQINGGTWLSYALGYICHKNFRLYEMNRMSPWNAMGTK